MIFWSPSGTNSLPQYFRKICNGVPKTTTLTSSTMITTTSTITSITTTSVTTSLTKTSMTETTSTTVIYPDYSVLNPRETCVDLHVQSLSTFHECYTAAIHVLKLGTNPVVETVPGLGIP